MSKGEGTPRQSEAMEARTHLACIGDMDPSSWVLPVPGDGRQLMSPPKALLKTPASFQLYVPSIATGPRYPFLSMLSLFFPQQTS